MSVECPTCGGKPWFKKVWWLYDHPDRLITLPDERFDVVPSKCPDCTPENVECPTCSDTGCILLDELEDDHSFYKSIPCPDCTPENVECQTCGPGGTCTPVTRPPEPENVECPTCRGESNDTPSWYCPDCTPGKSSG